MTAHAPAAARWWRDFIVCFLIALPFVFALSMTDGLSHDENQHVAAGALMAREGLLPYRDFPHFHTPYLAFAYSAFFRLTDHLLLAGRVFSTFCAAAAVALVGAATAGVFRAHSPRRTWIAVAGAVVLALTARVFTHTTGHAWNHEPALLASLAAFLLLVSGIARSAGARIFGAGLLLGLAIGLRLTCAPLVAPFGLAVLLLGPSLAGRRVALAAWFSGGLLLALGGIAWLAVLAPDQAWFGNFEFARVNVLYRFSTGEPRTMTLLKKLRYLFKNIALRDIGLVVAFLAPLVAVMHQRIAARRRLPLLLVALLWCLPFLFLGSLAPSPLFEQYFYPFVFFLILGGASALAALPATARWLPPVALLVAAGILYSAVRGVSGYREFAEVIRPSKWTPIEIHDEAAFLRTLPADSRVLTLEPIPVLEAGRRIYPEFGTGPFAWRIGPYVDRGRVARLRIPTPDTLLPLLAADPPAALLLGAEDKGEQLLKSYAKSHGYRRIPDRDEDELWVRP